MPSGRHLECMCQGACVFGVMVTFLSRQPRFGFVRVYGASGKAENKQEPVNSDLFIISPKS